MNKKLMHVSRFLANGNYRLGGMLEGDTTLDGELVSAKPDGSSIIMEVTPTGEVVWVTVLDTNIGVSETQVDRMDRTHLVSRAKDEGSPDLPTDDIYSAELVALDKKGEKLPISGFPPAVRAVSASPLMGRTVSGCRANLKALLHLRTEKK